MFWANVFSVRDKFPYGIKSTIYHRLIVKLFWIAGFVSFLFNLLHQHSLILLNDWITHYSEASIHIRWRNFQALNDLASNRNRFREIAPIKGHIQHTEHRNCKQKSIRKFLKLYLKCVNWANCMGELENVLQVHANVLLMTLPPLSISLLNESRPSYEGYTVHSIIKSIL